METFSEYLCFVLNSALDAEIERKVNVKKVNRWYKQNTGDPYFPRQLQTDKDGNLSFIYLQPNANEYFLYDYHLDRKAVEGMIENGTIVYYGEILFQGVKHKAWTTARNAKMLINRN